MKHPQGCGCGKCTSRRRPVSRVVRVTAADITLVTSSKCRRLLLPVERGSAGELITLDREPGDVFTLKPGAARKGSVRVTTLRVDLVPFAECARPWITGGRTFAVDELVWRVELVLGDRSAFFEKNAERYLKAKGVGTTIDPRLAARGEPAVTTDDELRFASVAAEKRELEREQQWRAARAQMRAAIDALRTAGGDPADVGFMERRLAKMDRARAEQRAA